MTKSKGVAFSLVSSIFKSIKILILIHIQLYLPMITEGKLRDMCSIRPSFSLMKFPSGTDFEYEYRFALYDPPHTPNQLLIVYSKSVLNKEKFIKFITR